MLGVTDSRCLTQVYLIISESTQVIRGHEIILEHRLDSVPSYCRRVDWAEMKSESYRRFAGEDCIEVMRDFPWLCSVNWRDPVVDDLIISGAVVFIWAYVCDIFQNMRCINEIFLKGISVLTSKFKVWLQARANSGALSSLTPAGDPHLSTKGRDSWYSLLEATHTTHRLIRYCICLQISVISNCQQSPTAEN